jgi:SAM-dependent methyltransferase
VSGAAVSPETTLALRQSRRHPRPTQFDYLYLRRLVDSLAAALRHVAGPVSDVLDVYCGTRPYEDLVPSSARYVAMDRTDYYGVADVVSEEFLPFDDESFDVVLCTEAFYYVPDPAHGLREIHRVLRPGGTVVMTLPIVWEYNRTILEHRYTGPELGALFEGWSDLQIVENGSRAVSWATLTGRIVHSAEERLPSPLALVARPAFALAYLGINGIGALLDLLEKRLSHSDYTLPTGLLVSAHRPRGENGR